VERGVVVARFLRRVKIAQGEGVLPKLEPGQAAVEPGEQEVPEGCVRWRQVMRGLATHARAGSRQDLPVQRANGLESGHGL